MSRNLAQQITFWRTLSHLMKANISLFESLTIVKTVINSDRLLRFIHQLQDAIMDGDVLSHNLELSPFQAQMLSLAEKIGNYAFIFSLIADHLAWRQSWRVLLVQAVRYPLILLGIMGILLSIIVLFVLPGVKAQLSLLGVQDIPLATKILMAVGQYPVAIGSGMMLMILVVYGIGRWRRSQGFKPWRYSLPIIGRILYQLELTQFLHALGVMLSAKLDMLTSLYQAAQTPSCPWIRGQLVLLEANLIQGQPLSQALSGVLPKSSPAAALIPVGEATGELGTLLITTCEADLEILQQKIKSVLDLLQPSLVILMGGLMIWVVLAVLLPLYDAVGQWHG
ncbi:MAG: type II secretion system F family protein [Candidatus Paracaedibacteraceae bacterium]|nr:type II secretion system F family protein [Candidatus Paracaedibacteraceae bacterium]